MLTGYLFRKVTDAAAPLVVYDVSVFDACQGSCLPSVSDVSDARGSPTYYPPGRFCCSYPSVVSANPASLQTKLIMAPPSSGVNFFSCEETS